MFPSDMASADIDYSILENTDLTMYDARAVRREVMRQLANEQFDETWGVITGKKKRT